MDVSLRRLFVLALFLFALPFVSAVGEDAVILHYDFENGFTDVSGRANGGTPNSVDRVLNPALTGFSAAAGQNVGFGDEVIALPAINSEISGDFTFATWYVASVCDASNNRLLDDMDFGSNNNAMVWVDEVFGSCRVQFMTGDGANVQGAATGSTLFSAGTAHHLVARRTGTVLEVFVDGVLDGSFDQVTATGATTPNTIWIGSDAMAESYDGFVDDLYLFNRSLSNSEITNLYTESIPVVGASVTVFNDTMVGASENTWIDGGMTPVSGLYMNGYLNMTVWGLGGALLGTNANGAFGQYITEPGMGYTQDQNWTFTCDFYDPNDNSQAMFPIAGCGFYNGMSNELFSVRADDQYGGMTSTYSYYDGTVNALNVSRSAGWHTATVFSDATSGFTDIYIDGVLAGQIANLDPNNLADLNWFILYNAATGVGDSLYDDVSFQVRTTTPAFPPAPSLGNWVQLRDADPGDWIGTPVASNTTTNFVRGIEVDSANNKTYVCVGSQGTSTGIFVDAHIGEYNYSTGSVDYLATVSTGMTSCQFLNGKIYVYGQLMPNVADNVMYWVYDIASNTSQQVNVTTQIGSNSMRMSVDESGDAYLLRYGTSGQGMWKYNVDTFVLTDLMTMDPADWMTVPTNLQATSQLFDPVNNKLYFGGVRATFGVYDDGASTIDDLRGADTADWIGNTANATFALRPILIDDGLVWVAGSSGTLGTYDPNTNTLTQVVSPWTSLAVRAEANTARGVLYFFLPGGRLYEYNKTSGVFTDLSGTDAGDWVSTSAALEAKYDSANGVLFTSNTINTTTLVVAGFGAYYPPVPEAPIIPQTLVRWPTSYMTADNAPSPFNMWMADPSHDMGRPLYKMFDNDVTGDQTMQMGMQNGQPHVFTIYMGEQINLVQLEMLSTGDGNAAHPTEFFVYGSNDNSTWVELYQNSSLDYSLVTCDDVDCRKYPNMTMTTNGMYSYFMFNFTQGDGGNLYLNDLVLWSNTSSAPMCVAPASVVEDDASGVAPGPWTTILQGVAPTYGSAPDSNTNAILAQADDVSCFTVDTLTNKTIEYFFYDNMGRGGQYDGLSIAAGGWGDGQNGGLFAYAGGAYDQNSYGYFMPAEGVFTGFPRSEGWHKVQMYIEDATIGGNAVIYLDGAVVRPFGPILNSFSTPQYCIFAANANLVTAAFDVVRVYEGPPSECASGNCSIINSTAVVADGGEAGTPSANGWVSNAGYFPGDLGVYSVESAFEGTGVLKDDGVTVMGMYKDISALAKNHTYTVKARMYVPTGYGGDMSVSPIRNIQNNGHYFGVSNAQSATNFWWYDGQTHQVSSVPVLFDQWNEIEVVVHNDAKTFSYYANGQAVVLGAPIYDCQAGQNPDPQSGGCWAAYEGSGILLLYGPTAGSGAKWDNIELFSGTDTQLYCPTSPVVYTGFDGATTNFGANPVNDQPVLEKIGQMKIEWNGVALDFAGADLDQFVTYGAGWVNVQSANLPVGVNTSANVTVYANVADAVIYVDGVVCQDCVVLSEGAGQVKFSVSHFSNYSVSGLISYWNGDNGVNLVGSGQNLTETGTPGITASKIGNGYVMTNTGTDFWSANAAGLPYGANARTFCAWEEVTFTQPSQNAFLYAYGNTGTNYEGFGLYVGATEANGRVQTYLEGDDAEWSVASEPGTGMHFLCVVYNGTDVLNYKDGSLDSTETLPVNTVQSMDFTIGKHGVYSGTYSPGSIDELAVWDRALNDSEVAFQYNGGLGTYFNGSEFIQVVLPYTAAWEAQFLLNSTVASTLTDFPARVEVDGAALIANSSLDASCAGLRVFDGVTPLSYEIEGQTCNTNQTVLWVKIPSFTSAGFTVNVTAANYPIDGQNAVDVWSNGYHSVFHASDASWSGVAIDSAGSANGTYVGSTATLSTACPIGFGQCWNMTAVSAGTGSDYIDWSGAGGFNPSATNITLSIRYHNPTPFDAGDDYPNLLSGDGTDWYWYQYRLGDTLHYSNGNSVGGTGTAGGSVLDDTSYFLSTRVEQPSPTNARMQINGVIADGGVTQPFSTTQSTSTFKIFASPYANSVQAYVDEFRIATEYRTDDWMLAEYAQTFEPVASAPGLNEVNYSFDWENTLTDSLQGYTTTSDTSFTSSGVVNGSYALEFADNTREAGMSMGAGSQALSVCSWFTTSVTQSQTLFNAWDNSNGDYAWTLYTEADNRIVAHVYDSAWSGVHNGAPVYLTPGQADFVCVTFNSSETRYWLNGAYAGDSPTTSWNAQPMTCDDTRCRLGNSDYRGDSGFIGQIDLTTVMVNHSLTDAEVLAMYNAQAPKLSVAGSIWNETADCSGSLCQSWPFGVRDTMTVYDGSGSVVASADDSNTYTVMPFPTVANLSAAIQFPASPTIGAGGLQTRYDGGDCWGDGVGVAVGWVSLYPGVFSTCSEGTWNPGVTTFTPGWHTVKIVRNGDNYETFVDGVSQWSGTTTSPGEMGDYIKILDNMDGGQVYVDNLAVFAPGGYAYFTNDTAEVGTPAGNGWVVAEDSPVMSYSAGNIFNGTASIEMVGGFGSARMQSANISGTWANKTLDFWMYDDGVSSFSLVGMGSNMNPLEGYYVQRNLFVDVTYYVVGGPNVNAITTYPMSTGWHHFQMYMNADMTASDVYVDGVFAVQLVDTFSALKPVVELYAPGGETITIDDMYVYEGAPVVPVVLVNYTLTVQMNDTDNDVLVNDFCADIGGSPICTSNNTIYFTELYNGTYNISYTSGTHVNGSVNVALAGDTTHVVQTNAIWFGTFSIYPGEAQVVTDQFYAFGIGMTNQPPWMDVRCYGDIDGQVGMAIDQSELYLNIGYGTGDFTADFPMGPNTTAYLNAVSGDMLNHTFEVACHDFGEVVPFAYESNEFTVSLPYVDASGFDGATTNFSTLDITSLDEPVLEKVGEMKIEWTGFGLNFNTANFTQYVAYGSSSVNVDSSNLPADVNTTANVTLYGSYVNPIVYADGVPCVGCSVLSNNGSDVVFSVPHFTNYTLVNGSIPTPDMNITAFTCEANVIPNEDNIPSVALMHVNATTVGNLTNVSLSTTLGVGTCSYTNGTNTTKYWECTVQVNYYSAPGAHTANLTYGNVTATTSTCSVTQLMAFKRTANVIAFPTAAPGVSNAPGTPVMGVRNTGNVPFTIFMTGQELVGRAVPTEKLNASYFKAGLTLGSAATMVQNAPVNLSMTVAPGQAAQGNVTLWLTMPSGQLMQEYYSVTPWAITATS